MDSSILSAASGLRWQLPVHTPSDEAQQDGMECQTIDTNARLVRDTALERPRIAHPSLNAGGDQGDPEAAPNASGVIASDEAAGRAMATDAAA